MTFANDQDASRSWCCLRSAPFCYSGPVSGLRRIVVFVVLVGAAACNACVVGREPGGDAQTEVVDTTPEVEAVCSCGTTDLAPPAMAVAGGLAVPIDVELVGAKVTLRIAERRASVEARLVFSLGPLNGFPVFDLRQTPGSLLLDGEPVEVGLLQRFEFAMTDTGGVLVLRRELDSCSRHELVVQYDLSSDGGRDTLPYWAQGVVWSSAFSDRIPGMLIERWFPTGLIHDNFELELEVQVVGGDEHTLLANASIEEMGANHWKAHWHEADSSTPLWYLSRSQHIEHWPDDSGAVDLHYAAGMFGTGQADWLSIAHEAIGEYTERFGLRAAMDRPYLLIIDPFRQPSDGVEYANGAIVGLPTRDVLRHEILHAWLGRSLLPARHIDAWWDEGAATFFSADEATALPVAQALLDPSDPNAEPIASSDPWVRGYSLDAYTTGSRIFATLVDLLGRDRVEQALRKMVEGCPHGHITNGDLVESLAAIGEREAVEALFASWVTPRSGWAVRGTCWP